MLIGRDFVRGQKRFDLAPTILFDCTRAGGASSCRATLLFSSATSKAAASPTRPLHRGQVGRTPRTSSTKNFLDEFLHRPKKSKPEPSPPRSWSRSISNRQSHLFLFNRTFRLTHPARSGSSRASTVRTRRHHPRVRRTHASSPDNQDSA